MSAVENFIFDTKGKTREILNFLHPILIDLGLQDKVRYKIPFYYNKSWICYLNPVKGDQVELVFLRGNELSNNQGLLDARGRKQVMGLIIKEIKEIPLDTLYEVLQEAILLDESVPYQSKRNK